MSQAARPSLRDYLQAAASGNQVIAYLTLGDPPGTFLDVANQALEAGTLTLELGFPYHAPLEGAALSASHERALGAGVDTKQALTMFQSIAAAHPAKPLIAIVQWPALQKQAAREEFLDQVAQAGAAAFLGVGMPLWQLPAISAEVHARGMQTVVPCPPDASRKYLSIALRYCTGCIYVPRGRVTGGTQEFANIDDFCRTLLRQSDLPIVVGVGVKSPADVSEICSTPAIAAAVGSALVEHISQGGSAAEFVRALLAR